MSSTLGGSGGYVKSGYHLVLPEHMLKTALRNAEMQRGVGVRTEAMSNDAWTQSLPWLNQEGVAGVLFEADGGHADPVASTEVYIAAFKRAGEPFRPGRRPGRSCARGTVSPASNWMVGRSRRASSSMLQALGQSPLQKAPASSCKCDPFASRIPFGRRGAVSRCRKAVFRTLLMRSIFARLEIAGSSLGAAFPKDYIDVDPYNYKETADDVFIADVQSRLELRFPSFAGARLIASYAALYDVTVDWYPYVGPRSNTAGYVDFCGGSGHGFKIAPAMAQELAQLILSGTAAEDFKQLSYDRIESGRTFAGSTVEIAASFGGLLCKPSDGVGNLTAFVE